MAVLPCITIMWHFTFVLFSFLFLSIFSFLFFLLLWNRTPTNKRNASRECSEKRRNKRMSWMWRISMLVNRSANGAATPEMETKTIWFHTINTGTRFPTVTTIAESVQIRHRPHGPHWRQYRRLVSSAARFDRMEFMPTMRLGVRCGTSARMVLCIRFYVPPEQCSMYRMGCATGGITADVDKMRDYAV